MAVELRDDTIKFGILRFCANKLTKFVLILWLGDSERVSPLRRGIAMTHCRAVRDRLEGLHTILRLENQYERSLDWVTDKLAAVCGIHSVQI